jgi:hypothetical protein
VARRRSGRPSAFRVPPPVGVPEQLLLLHPRSGLGAVFIKTIAYAPFSVWVYLNGNEWAKQQTAQQEIAFKPLDNGIAACEDPAALAWICQSLSAADVWAFFERWQARLPSPLTAEDRRRGVRACARVPAA